jgi:hypothetical protein
MSSLKGFSMANRCMVSGFILAILGWPVLASAEGAAGNTVEQFRQQGFSVRTVTPIFSQLLVTGSPPGFDVISFEKTRDQFYIRESVLKGESVNGWSQMISVTGMKDLASKPEATPKIVLNGMADGFKRSCPFTFNTKVLSDGPINGSDAAVAVVSCGTSTGTAGKTSESAVIAVIKGKADFYTVQWAERTAPSNAPIPIDLKKWTDRFKALGPVRLCPIVPGEKAPYPSCVGDGQKKPT